MHMAMKRRPNDSGIRRKVKTENTNEHKMYRYSYNILFSEEDKMKNLMCNFGFRG
jgi:hypothetical protein